MLMICIVIMFISFLLCNESYYCVALNETLQLANMLL